MYRMERGQMRISEFILEDTFKLDSKNRWMQKAKVVPWDKAEEKYSYMFKKNGRPAKAIRMALGALIIQQTLKLSDEETVAQIMENPYLQYFIGLERFTNEAPFHPTLMVWFRKRLSLKFMEEINEAMCSDSAKPEVEESDDENEAPPTSGGGSEAEDETEGKEEHGGTMIVDASCTPANITYPTDTGLLADAIEKTDEMIDILHEPHMGERRRPRTYREKSRKMYVSFVKQRKPQAKTIRKCKGKQLNYLKRNLGFVHKMLEEGGELPVNRIKQLETIDRLYAQQREMHQNKTHQVADRIVSISQPHVRPIVRGKAGATVEFGAKIDVSVVGGYVFLNHASWDAFHEGILLENAISDYYRRFGMLPKEILADRAYQTRDNRRICAEMGIKLMGKPLGRPRKNQPPVRKRDGRRNEVEGKFGTLKTCYKWNRIMARLPETSMASIAMAAFALNLTKRALALLRFFAMFENIPIYYQPYLCPAR